MGCPESPSPTTPPNKLCGDSRRGQRNELAEKTQVRKGLQPRQTQPVRAQTPCLMSHPCANIFIQVRTKCSQQGPGGSPPHGLPPSNQ